MMTTATCWSYKAGEKGRNRVRVYEDRPGGPLRAEFVQDGQKRRIRLDHRDQARAKQLADKMAAAFGETGQPTGSDPTLAALFDIYLRERTPTKTAVTQAHDRSCVAMFLKFYGAMTKVRSLNRRDWDRFIRGRHSGQVGLANSSGKGVGDRQVEHDLKFLMAVLNWAVTCANSHGKPLLDRNPLKGLPYPKETAPARPVMTSEQYEGLLKVSGEIDQRFRLALIVAHETGHRIGAIRRLRWADVDFNGKCIHWRAENDKIGHEHTTPIIDCLEALREAQQQSQAIGEAWVFPSPDDPTKPCPRERMTKWMVRAKENAGILMKGLGWHALRRQFASEHMDEPLKVLCELGGWKDPQTVLRCYQHPDQDALREALKRRKA